MIDPKELRIGNLIFVENKIRTVRGDDLALLDTPYTRQLIRDQVHPIPLDAEWLERLGFEKEDGIWRKSIGLYVYIIWTHWKEAWITTPGEVDFRVNVKYIHSLQNLFYALTGAELTVKETA